MQRMTSVNNDLLDVWRDAISDDLPIVMHFEAGKVL